MAVVSLTSVGDPRYGLCANQTVRSVLDHTDFDVVAYCDSASAALLPSSDRVTVVEDAPIFVHRADRFLIKFAAWRAALDASDEELIVHLDVDAAVCAPIDDADLLAALGAGQFAMVEQTGITGSTMDRAAFLDHYLAHSHHYIAPLLPAPDLEEFRFFNSGVIVFRRLELENLLVWAEGLLADLPDHHRVGEHMIADQDYLQVWANVVRRSARSEMGPEWNHCPLWDDDFPRSDVRVVHLSNFCNGPPVRTALALQDHRSRRRTARDDGRWPDISFCLVTHDSGAELGDCLTALAAFDGAEIVVVDNASTDATRSILAEHGIVPILNDRNEGFAVAANRAASFASRSVLCFVNPDAFIHLDALAGVVDRIDREPNLALVPDYVHADGGIERGVQPGYTRTKIALDLLRTGRADDSFEWIERISDPHDAGWNWPLAACLAISRSTFGSIGGFDERYFVYMEDVALGRRLHDHGGSVASTGTTVLHLGAQGSSMERSSRDVLLDEARWVYATNEYGNRFGTAMDGLRRIRDGIVRRTR